MPLSNPLCLKCCSADHQQRQAARHQLQHQQLLLRRRSAVRLQLPGHHREQPPVIPSSFCALSLLWSMLAAPLGTSAAQAPCCCLCLQACKIPLYRVSNILNSHHPLTQALVCAPGICLWRPQRHLGDPGNAAKPATDIAAVHARRLHCLRDRQLVSQQDLLLRVNCSQS